MILQFHVWVFIEGNKNINYNIYWKDVQTPICTVAWFIIFIISRYRNNVNAHEWMKTTLSLFPYMCVCVCLCARTCVLCHVWLFMTPWTAVHQAPLSMEFSRQEYWSGLPFPTPGDLSDPGIEPMSPVSPVMADGFFTTEPPGKPHTHTHTHTHTRK